MATRKMTFSLPAELARRFLRHVPARQRSRYLAEALDRSLKRREAVLIRSCHMANADPGVAAIEQEMDAIADPIEEPWNEPPAR
jgi:hypothetical protein